MIKKTLQSESERERERDTREKKTCIKIKKLFFRFLDIIEKNNTLSSKHCTLHHVAFKAASISWLWFIAA